MPNSDDKLSIKGWLLRGAIREDDLGTVTLLLPPPFPISIDVAVGDDPHDDPYGSFFRVFNHFYDPIHHRPLTVAGVDADAVMNPDWALGTADVFTDPGIPDPARRNHFTWFDAREAEYRAVTGLDKYGNPAGLDPNLPATAADRRAYWATVFRSLGDMAHLLQDMAQPQHTRNDAHAGARYDGTRPPIGHKSVYEAYTEARATGAGFRTVSPGGNGAPTLTTPIDLIPPPLAYTPASGDYPVPQFVLPGLYFTARHTGLPELARRGLADYSNRGFFTAGKNLSNTDYEYPSRDPAAYAHLDLRTDWYGRPLDTGYAFASTELLTHWVYDAYANTMTPDVPLTTYSIWDQFLEQAGHRFTYTLNRYNYDAQADLLIPRAVAYSAGLINHFFRGRLAIAPPDEGVYGLIDHATVNLKDVLAKLNTGTTVSATQPLRGLYYWRLIFDINDYPVTPSIERMRTLPAGEARPRPLVVCFDADPAQASAGCPIS